MILKYSLVLFDHALASIVLVEQVYRSGDLHSGAQKSFNVETNHAQTAIGALVRILPVFDINNR